MRSLAGEALGGSSEQKLAQVITAGITGGLVEVRVAAQCTPADTIHFEIQGVSATGAPNGTVLYAADVHIGLLPTADPALQSIALSPPVQMAAGARYSVVLTAASTAGCGLFPGPPGDTYPGGASFYDSRPNAPGWVGGDNDLVFQTFVQ